MAFVFVGVLFLLRVVGAEPSEEPDGLQLHLKLPRIPLMKYESYANVMLLHFFIPDDTTKAVFKFKARDEQSSLFSKGCDLRNVSVYLKTGSYPVINPDGIPFPNTFLNITRPTIHELSLQTDWKVAFLNISSPLPGDWFAATFLSWSDPKKDPIQQQGLTSKCDAYLFSELLIATVPNITVLGTNSDFNILFDQQMSKLYKFYVANDVDHVLISVSVLRPCKSCGDLEIFAQNRTVPNEFNYGEKMVVNSKQDGISRMRIWPDEGSWNYLNVTLPESKTNKAVKDFLNLTISIKFINGLDKFVSDNNDLFKTALNKVATSRDRSLRYSVPYRQYNLVRFAAPDNFVFEYDFRPTQNGSTPLLLNVTSDQMTVLKFVVYEIIDIGGALTLGISLKPGSKPDADFTIVACINRGVQAIPVYPHFCSASSILAETPFVLNSTDPGALQVKHIPYPDPGSYYLSLRAFPGECQPCNCSQRCDEVFDRCLLERDSDCTTNATCDLLSRVELCKAQVLSTYGCAGCDCDGACEAASDLLNVSLIFSVSSRPCIGGTCGPHGRCNEYIAGGFIFSSCQCNGGYRGWDCLDDSEADTEGQILLALLLLTLSNLMFIPSIFFAFRRRYYTEAVVYFLSMTSSTFYHACDSKENQYGLCVFPIGVLQFCDFYCALLAIWVTIIAMAYTNTQIISICHLTGAIVLAFGITYNKYALWVYILPTLCGFLIIGVSWGLQCRRRKKLFPAKMYLKLYLPIGLLLSVLGIISFAFLETKENYKIVHSSWHVIMALSLLFLLPNSKTFVVEK